MASKIDLHTHSTASDGSLSPSELVRAAKEAGLAAIALTDHDTLAGCDEFMSAGKREGIDTIPGVEISCEVPGRTCHMLGYFLTEPCLPLSETLEDIRRHREDRNRLIVERLRTSGVDITLREIEAVAGDGIVSRNHFAQCLVQKGIVQSTQEAFDRFLARGRPAYVERTRLSPEEACRQILASGGLPVLAHPAQLNFGCGELVSFVRGLVDHGLCGIEAFYPDNDPSHVVEELRVAKELGLEVTAGSDFHGIAKPNVTLGGTVCPWPEQSPIVNRLRQKLQPIDHKRETL
jgi:predicted metal-dependent phosphoesterase TrpH